MGVALDRRHIVIYDIYVVIYMYVNIKEKIRNF